MRVTFVLAVLGVVVGGLISLAGIVYVQRKEDERALRALQHGAFAKFLDGITLVRSAVVCRVPGDENMPEPEYKSAVRSSYESLLMGFGSAVLLCGSDQTKEAIATARERAARLVQMCLDEGLLDDNGDPFAPGAKFDSLRDAQFACIAAMQNQLGMDAHPAV